uniref:Putative E3 ubiquitin-protein ligase PRT1 n=1 Tax=Davidia involucrata TaxID=16924 RepID=A0A5B6YGM1_DAVIN
MENQPKDSAEIETEEFPDEFKCCVCLDFFYKPIVLACGHISCFWCVNNAMDTWQESHCPVCRHPYNHFPGICQLLHFLLMKLYPLSYKRRERQVREEEEEIGFFSPQFDDFLSASHPSKESDQVDAFSSHSTMVSENQLYLKSCSSGEGEPSLTKDSSNITVPDKDNTMSTPTTSTCETTRNVTAHENGMLGNKLVRGSCSQVLITDLLCAICKKLLCRPVVLNCGHVYCEACIINPGDEVCRCQNCHIVQPNGLPKVCLVLEHFLEEQFSEEYAARKEAVLKQVDSDHGSPSKCSTQSQKHAAQSSLIPTNDYSSRWSSQGPKVHIGVGCDFCGMCPIIGERYKCKDCVEKIGFDLCEGCYNSSSKLPGRFNQQHTPEHTLEIVQPQIPCDLIWRLGAVQTEEDDSDDPEDREDVLPAPSLSDDAPLDPEDGSAALICSNDTLANQEEDVSPAPVLSDDAPLDQEDGSAAFICSSDTLEDQEGYMA